jgi:2-hydroxymuconate-semialdehyde hydrolase
MTQAKASPEIGKSIQAGGAKTNYHDVGSGTPVILIHGSGPGVSAWANWQFAIPFLGEKFRVLAYDQLGFGYSDPAPNQHYSLEGWTNHLLSFMKAVGVERHTWLVTRWVRR